MHNPDKLAVLRRAKALNIRMHQLPLRGIGLRAPGLRSQLLRATSSIPANIVEALDQPSAKSTARFLSIAIASANELELHLELASALKVLGHPGPELQRELKEIRKMLFGFRAHILKEPDPPKPDANPT